MIVALLSDIHSNLHALEVVLESIEEYSAELTLCAGDIVGYGAYPNECCVAVEDSGVVSVSGNHDIAALTSRTEGMNTYASAAALWTAEHLDERSVRTLSSLPASIQTEVGGVDVSVYHGSDSDPDEYVHEEEADEGIIARAGSRVVVLGHTHTPFIRRFGRGIVVNPGSVGQPRDGDPRASFAVLDTTDLSCEVQRTAYDVEAASEAILSAGLPLMLAQRLSVGR